MSKAVQNELRKKHILNGTFNKLKKIGDRDDIIKSFSTDVNTLNSTDYVQTISPVTSTEQLKYGLYKSHDDLMAALANFNFRCALQYSVEFTRIEDSYRIIEHYFKADENIHLQGY